MTKSAEVAAAFARAQARTGMEMPTVRFAIDRSDLRRYARACNETLAAYVNGDEAAPTFISSLQTEGMVASQLFEKDLPFASKLHSDDVVELHRPIRAGDILFATGRYCGAELKNGRNGPMLFQTAEMILRDEAGLPVGRVASTLVSF